MTETPGAASASIQDYETNRSCLMSGKRSPEPTVPTTY